jgi:phosphomannomutase
MVSLGIVKLQADLGVVITASHNPPSYNGFKLKGAYGGPLLEKEIHEVEHLILETFDIDLDKLSIEEFKSKKLIEVIDLEKMYCDNLEANFDLEAIRNSDFEFAFDAMYGSGQNVIRRLLPDVTLLHCEHNPTFNGIAPEPLHKNLLEFSEMIQLSENIDCGLAVDGDADRIAMYDNEGNYID